MTRSGQCLQERRSHPHISRWKGRRKGRTFPDGPRLASLLTLGWTEQDTGELDRAEGRFFEAHRLAEEDRAPYRDMAARRGIAWCAISRGEHHRAAALFEGILEQSREAGVRWLESTALNGLGELARFGGDVERARTCYLGYRLACELWGRLDDDEAAERLSRKLASLIQ